MFIRKDLKAKCNTHAIKIVINKKRRKNDPTLSKRTIETGHEKSVKTMKV